MRDLSGLLKIAYAFNDISTFSTDIGSPSSFSTNSPVSPTVGDVMHSINANFQNINPIQRRNALDNIIQTGIPVNDPADKLLSAMRGRIVGESLADKFHLGPTGRGIAQIAGMTFLPKMNNLFFKDPIKRMF